MQICRIYATEDGESHFEDVEVEFSEACQHGSLSAPVAVSKLKFRKNPANYDHSWHTSPGRLYVVMLDGRVEVEVSNGQKRTFQGGDVFLAEDTFGKGHRTRNIDLTPRRSLFISLDN